MYNIIIDHRAEKELRLFSNENSSQAVRVMELFKKWGFNLTDKHLKRITKELWELRARRVRLLFGVIGNVACVVNIFLKKTQKTPRKEIETALQRLKIYHEK